MNHLIKQILVGSRGVFTTKPNIYNGASLTI